MNDDNDTGSSKSGAGIIIIVAVGWILVSAILSAIFIPLLRWYQSIP